MTPLEVLGRKLAFERAELVDEFLRSDLRLQLLCLHAHDAAHVCGYQLVWTCVERTYPRTLELYRKARQALPRYPGAHDVRPSRAADGVLRAVKPTIADIGAFVEAQLNSKFVCARGKAAVYHDVGGVHLHCEVPPDALSVLPLPGAPGSGGF